MLLSRQLTALDFLVHLSRNDDTLGLIVRQRRARPRTQSARSDCAVRRSSAMVALEDVVRQRHVARHRVQRDLDELAIHVGVLLVRGLFFEPTEDAADDAGEPRLAVPRPETLSIEAAVPRKCDALKL